jgi:hypothetical protein
LEAFICRSAKAPRVSRYLEKRILGIRWVHPTGLGGKGAMIKTNLGGVLLATFEKHSAVVQAGVKTPGW